MTETFTRDDMARAWQMAHDELCPLVREVCDRNHPNPHVAPPLPPEAVEWAEKIGNKSRPGWWNEGVYEAAMFILAAAGKDTDDE